MLVVRNRIILNRIRIAVKTKGGGRNITPLRSQGRNKALPELAALYQGLLVGLPLQA